MLLQTDEEFRQLADKHRELEHRLSELAHKPYLSEPEQVEELTIKKRKLQLKDRMEDIMRRFAGSSGAQALSA
ncbi:MAG: YdcH family protein [Acidobacteria bacterium]|nr:YdcH family protein [Acidobacteriota bacterium]